MARFVAGFRSSAGSTTLPIASVYSSSTVNPHVIEIGVSNTTAVAVALKLCKLTTAGTQGTGLAETNLDAGAYTASCTAFNTHSSTGPTVVDLGYNITLGGVVGAGWIWTFGDTGISVPAGTGNGIGIIVATGTGQVLDGYITWTE
jgi:hypothetical protein